ncbi:stress responsive protein [Aliiroseovarius zhejiangensis]|uniref:Stress responsive protein n=1 Tax=Aliiroseovarius zhejiangensis TaxID=1632025 RepID=A0ABQ3IYJ9_9RHOB|nr:Dabb family protein [Aliiroseovarius zhejiangensis]GHE97834.1 stress responsive protein [Aliiroseovarius zhejiangensis]
MIRHIVFFTAKRAEDRDTIRAGLELLKDIPHCLRLEVAENFATDPIPGPSPDVVVYGEFKDEAQLAAYKAHPLYQQSIARVRPLRELRVAADFMADG